MRVLKWLDEHFEEMFMVYLLVLIASVMMLQVIMRYIFNNSLSWPEEFCRYCYVWSAFLSLGFTMRAGNMLRVSIVMDLLPKTLRNVMGIITQVIVIAFFSLFFYYSIKVVESIRQMGQTSTAMGWPMHMVYYSTVIGFALGAIRGGQALINKIRNFSKEAETTLEAIQEEAKSEADIATIK